MAGKAPRAAKAKKPRKTRKPSLSPRQAKLREGLAEGKSTRRAALDAGYSVHSANKPQELLSRPALREALAELLVPVEKIAERINEGLDAVVTETYSHVIGSKIQGDDHIELKHVDKIAWSERRKYAVLAARLKGLMPGEKLEIEGEIAQEVIVRFEHVGS